MRGERIFWNLSLLGLIGWVWFGTEFLDGGFRPRNSYADGLRKIKSDVIVQRSSDTASDQWLIGERRNTVQQADLNVLAKSGEGKALSAHARLLAQSVRKEDHDELSKWLQDQEFLNRLDAKEQYQGPPRKLRLWEVLRELKQNTAPSAHLVLLKLTQNSGFLQEVARIDLLIQASAVIRPAPLNLIEFWDRHSQPEDGFSHLTIEAIVENGTAPALDLLEKKMRDPAHSDEDKNAWMITSILTHRNDLLLLQTCENLLREGLSVELRPSLVEALFDYRPTEWYSPATLLVPPKRARASREALKQSRKLGAQALSDVNLNETQRNAVERALQEINELLKDTMPMSG